MEREVNPQIGIISIPYENRDLIYVWNARGRYIKHANAYYIRLEDKNLYNMFGRICLRKAIVYVIDKGMNTEYVSIMRCIGHGYYIYIPRRAIEDMNMTLVKKGKALFEHAYKEYEFRGTILIIIWVSYAMHSGKLKWG